MRKGFVAELKPISSEERKLIEETLKNKVTDDETFFQTFGKKLPKKETEQK